MAVWSNLVSAHFWRTASRQRNFKKARRIPFWCRGRFSFTVPTLFYLLFFSTQKLYNLQDSGIIFSSLLISKSFSLLASWMTSSVNLQASPFTNKFAFEAGETWGRATCCVTLNVRARSWYQPHRDVDPAWGYFLESRGHMICPGRQDSWIGSSVRSTESSRTSFQTSRWSCCLHFRWFWSQCTLEMCIQTRGKR